MDKIKIYKSEVFTFYYKGCEFSIVKSNGFYHPYKKQKNLDFKENSLGEAIECCLMSIGIPLLKRKVIKWELMN